MLFASWSTSWPWPGNVTSRGRRRLATSPNPRSPRRSPSWNASSNVTLIYRGQNFEGLTLEGERLVVWAKRMLAEHDGLKAEAAAMRAGISGTLRLGTGPTVSTTTALPVAAFCGLHPLAKVTICSRLSSTELLRQLRNFELDAAIAHFGPDDRSGLEVVPLYRERYVLLVSGDHLASGARSITWAEAAQLPLALLTPHMRFRQFIDKAFAANGVVALPQVETDSVASLYAHVATGAWASVVPHPGCARFRRWERREPSASSSRRPRHRSRSRSMPARLGRRASIRERRGGSAVGRRLRLWSGAISPPKCRLLNARV